MLDKPRILSLSPARLIISIKHAHSCKILYLGMLLTLWEFSACSLFCYPNFNVISGIARTHHFDWKEKSGYIIVIVFLMSCFFYYCVLLSCVAYGWGLSALCECLDGGSGIHYSLKI